MGHPIYENAHGNFFGYENMGVKPKTQLSFSEVPSHAPGRPIYSGHIGSMPFVSAIFDPTFTMARYGEAALNITTNRIREEFRVAYRIVGE